MIGHAHAAARLVEAEAGFSCFVRPFGLKAFRANESGERKNTLVQTTLNVGRRRRSWDAELSLRVVGLELGFAANPAVRQEACPIGSELIKGRPKGASESRNERC